MKKIDFVFVGWGSNGEKCLEGLIQNKFVPSLIIVPKNFEVKHMFEIGKCHKIPVWEYYKNSQEFIQLLHKHKPELMIIASFPYLFPTEVIDYPKRGTINVHTAALPKYRGYHPLNWAIIKDEPTIGVTVHYVDQGMDTGDILGQELIPVLNTDDINTLKEKITQEAAKLLIKVVKTIATSPEKVQGIAQREADASFAPRRYERDGKINWSANTRDIFNLVRALKSPYPNAFSFTKNGDKVECSASFLSKTPGTVLLKLKDHYLITTGDGVILIKTSQSLQIGEVLQ